ncbi:MAG: quinolinate synthase NadA [Chthonomonas sp.]|nr:quinolinate synthase NadA [Chthonomonas sp.]
MSNLRPLDAVYARMQAVVPRAEWEIHMPKVERILELKNERDATVLAHTYQSPQIYFSIADITGDSLQLAREVARVERPVIVMCGVRFMAETSKILNPGKTVLLPDLRAGCSMADSLTAEDVRRLRAEHPGAPVVTYVNTNADVKAESDICCTSSNAVQVVRSLGASKVIFLPDPYLGKWVRSHMPEVEFVFWQGPCEVHVKFTAEDIAELKARYPGIEVLVHPECPEEVIAAADYTGSTSGMIRHIGERKLTQIALITECSMSSNVTAMFPGLQVVRPCNLCPHMQRITLDSVVEALEKMQHKISVEEGIRVRAQRALDRMLEVRLS